MRIVMNKTCLIPACYRLGSIFLLCSFLLSGCAETRYDGSRKYTSAPNEKSTSYTIGQHADATAHYTLGQNAKAKVYRIGQHDDATARYTLKQGGSSEPRSPVIQSSRPSEVGGPPEEQVSDAPIILEASEIMFEFDKWTIREEFYPELDKWVVYFTCNPLTTVRIYGHTDSTGPVAYNQKLSEKRAQAVVNYLVENGVAPERLTARGFGESRPAALNTTSEGRQKNRRVELDF